MTLDDDLRFEVVRTASGDYIACVGVRTVNVATCIESPTGAVVDLLRPAGQRLG